MYLKKIGRAAYIIVIITLFLFVVEYSILYRISIWQYAISIYIKIINSHSALGNPNQRTISSDQ